MLKNQRPIDFLNRALVLSNGERNKLSNIDLYLSGDLVIIIEDKAKVEDQAKSLKDNEDLQVDTSSVTQYASGVARTFSGGLRRSTVAHFARKVRGDECCGGQARAIPPPKKITPSLNFRGFLQYI